MTSPSHPHTLIPSHPHILTPSHPHTLTPSHPHTLSPSHPLTLTPSHPLTLTPSQLELYQGENQRLLRKIERFRREKDEGESVCSEVGDRERELEEQCQQVCHQRIVWQYQVKISSSANRWWKFEVPHLLNIVDLLGNSRYCCSFGR